MVFCLYSLISLFTFVYFYNRQPDFACVSNNSNLLTLTLVLIHIFSLIDQFINTELTKQISKSSILVCQFLSKVEKKFISNVVVVDLKNIAIVYLKYKLKEDRYDSFLSFQEQTGDGESCHYLDYIQYKLSICHLCYFLYSIIFQLIIRQFSGFPKRESSSLSKSNSFIIVICFTQTQKILIIFLTIHIQIISLIFLQSYFYQMAGQSITAATLQNYIYQNDKPVLAKGNYQVYNATQKQTNLPVTLKILKGYHLELPKYLKKLKDCKSDNVIKVYQTCSDAGTLLFISERVTFGNLAKALLKCQRLDDGDSVFLAKMVLNGHIDLLRSDCNWFGSQQDIEFTDSGIKLSWNNSISYNLVNPIPKILEKFSTRPQQKGADQSLLPFPKSKVMQELIKISKENASQISLNPQMKKKEKLAKKKGKTWLGLKQYRNKNQYFDQYLYLAVNQETGFIRVKIYDKAPIDSQVLNLNKTKRSFTKIIDCYEEGPKTIIVSQYSNDGNLQAYVTKLKTSNVTLTEQHIQFFFYSLFEPLKQVQESSVKSVSTLHIKNIFIENGIPKIGEPVPINESVAAILMDRAEVPDFYHAEFKKQPNTRNQIFDTYSLGVLLYKLMYTEYPIFPNGKVHIPSTPNYNKRLKNTLEIFLNEGGTLKSIQNRIQVSENVAKQVKQNKEKLLAKKQNAKQKGDSKRPILQNEQQEEEKEATEKQDKSDDQQQQEEDAVNCCDLCCNKLQLANAVESSIKSPSITGLEESPYKTYRICTKIILVSVFYIFLFYFPFLQSNTLLIASQNLLTSYNVTIATVQYSIITSDTNKFQTTFNQTSKNLASLTSMGCFISNYNNNPDYSSFVYQSSPEWIGFIVAALVAFIAIIIIKMWQIYNFDIVKAIYNRQHAKSDFNISNWLIFNLLYCCLIYGHFYFFNFVFNGKTQPCLSATNIYGSTYSLFNDRAKFNVPYLTSASIQLGIVLIHCIFIGCTYKVHYNKIVNPIILFGPFLITQWIIFRIGVINGYYYPNALQDATYGNIIKNYFYSGSYVNIFGIIPQILLIGQLLIGLLIDSIYWVCLDKRRRLLINQTSNASLGEV